MAPADFEAIIAGIDSYNAAQGCPTDWRPLAVTARDGAGHLLGGLAGASMFRWLFVQQLWVAPFMRGQGLGAALLRAAEAEAQARGCVGAWLDTLDVQAPGFYRRLGYVPFGALPDCPPGHHRHFLMRRFDPHAGASGG
ncbi:MAG: GNAT family N-acetyltransferase [Alphaproteobacteria bacterium]|nr:GNAT family N-acetyltransferase [Alphaproteobacteria bacterium]